MWANHFGSVGSFPETAGKTGGGRKTGQPAQSAGQGGLHRFALDTKAKHTRRSSTRARTGCSTCKLSLNMLYFSLHVLTSCPGLVHLDIHMLINLV